MKIFKLILLGILVTIWLLTSIAYFSLGEWIGFYFMQLLFVPLVAGLAMLYFNKILGIITLSFWFAMIYGSIIDLPLRHQILLLPIALLFGFFIRFAIIENDRYFKIMGWIFGALTIVLFIRALKIPVIIDTSIIISGGLLFFPLIIFYKSIILIKTQKITGFIVLAMAIIVFINSLARLFINLSQFEFSNLFEKFILGLMMISLGLVVLKTKGKAELSAINSTTLAYFVFVLFYSFTAWVLNSIQQVNG